MSKTISEVQASKFYFNDKPLLVVGSSDIKETTSFSLDEEPDSDKPSMDFLKPFSFSCEATVRKRDEKKLRKLLCSKKHRLPRKLKKAMRSDNPANSLYSLIPESQRKQFAEFAKSFGISEEMIKKQVK